MRRGIAPFLQAIRLSRESGELELGLLGVAAVVITRKSGLHSLRNPQHTAPPQSRN